MHLTNFILVFFACGSSVWFVSMFIAFRRSRMAPKCWSCGHSKVVAWKNHRSDYLALLSMMVPLRCMGCLTRFYGLRWVRPAARRRSGTPAVHVPRPQIIPVRLRIFAFSSKSKPAPVPLSNQTAGIESRDLQ